MIDKVDLVSLMDMGRKKRPNNKHYAGLNRRMLASTVDSFFLMLLEPLFDKVAPIHHEALTSMQVDLSDPEIGPHMIMQVLTNREFMGSWLLNTSLQLLVFCILSGLCWHFWSTTPGKMLMRIKIVDSETEGPISDRQIMKRLLGYWVSCFTVLGVLWIGMDSKKRGWHDFMAGTTVIVLPWKKKQKENQETYTLPKTELLESVKS